MMLFMRTTLLLAAFLPLVAIASDVPEIKIAGATTVFLSVVTNNKDQVAKENEVSITAIGSTTGKGFAALQADLGRPGSVTMSRGFLAAKTSPAWIR